MSVEECFCDGFWVCPQHEPDYIKNAERDYTEDKL